MTDFAGYEMPLWYSSTLDEHMAVRNSSGVFDVSHMGRFVVSGEPAGAFIEGLVPTQVQKQAVGKAFYTLLLDERAGILDDLIVLRLDEAKFMLVVNAANAAADLSHIQARSPPQGVRVDDTTGSSAMVAVQGPSAQSIMQPYTELDLGQLKRLRCAETKVMGQRSIISRTGYTGEDGFEVIVLDATNESPGRAMEFWEKITAASKPCGLGARDSLRLEAGLPLYGSDMDGTTNPFQADLGWVVSSAKTGYVGCDALWELKSSGPEVIRRGVVSDRGIPRHGFVVKAGSEQIGTVTSGTFSPILSKGIALCRLRNEGTEPGATVTIAMRDSEQGGKTVRPPFYDESIYGWKRHGKGN